MVTPIKVDDRVRQYRDLAAETRAIADGMTNEIARKGMLEAADVWDRLAEIAERHLHQEGDSLPSSRRPHI